MVASIVFESPVLVAPGFDLSGGCARNPQWSGHLQADVRPKLQEGDVLASGNLGHGPSGQDASPSDQEPVLKWMKVGEKS